jgi:hypothetical protein
MRLGHESVARKPNGEVVEFMPVTEPTTFELVINFKTAKGSWLTIPRSVLYRTSKVIR